MPVRIDVPVVNRVIAKLNIEETERPERPENIRYDKRLFIHWSKSVKLDTGKCFTKWRPEQFVQYLIFSLT